MSIKKCKLLKIPKIIEERGTLSFIELVEHVPFDIKRIFYIFNVPYNINRGEHAHIINHQLIICIKGEIDVYVDDGQDNYKYKLNDTDSALYIPPMIWSKQTYNSLESVCLVLASEKYEKSDYIYDYKDFLSKSNV